MCCLECVCQVLSPSSKTYEAIYWVLPRPKSQPSFTLKVVSVGHSGETKPHIDLSTSICTNPCLSSLLFPNFLGGGNVTNQLIESLDLLFVVLQSFCISFYPSGQKPLPYWWYSFLLQVGDLKFLRIKHRFWLFPRCFGAVATEFSCLSLELTEIRTERHKYLTINYRN